MQSSSEFLSRRSVVGSAVVQRQKRKTGRIFGFFWSGKPRMKEPDERAAFRVKSAQVRSLVRIAVVAGESEVSAVVSSAMLASDDVLNVIGEEWLSVLRQAAVSATITGSFTDSLPEPLVHQAA